jgi:hypothetical protein
MNKYTVVCGQKKLGVIEFPREVKAEDFVYVEGFLRKVISINNLIFGNLTSCNERYEVMVVGGAYENVEP